MKLLIVAATKLEVAPLKENFEAFNRGPFFKVDVLITGVGMVATAFALGKRLSSLKYDAALNLGIGGSFDHSFQLGTLVEVTEDHFCELGAEDGEAFIPIDTLGFGTSKQEPIASPLLSSLLSYPKVRAITVNTVSGKASSIQKLKTRINPQLESQEGAAFFYCCRQMGLPCMQLRAIANYVEQRQRSQWNIPLAVENLNQAAIIFLNKLAKLLP